MNKKMWRNSGGHMSTGFGLILLAGLALTFLGCPPSSGGKKTSIVVTISPKTATVAKGGYHQFFAEVEETSNTAVTWTVTGGGSGTAIVDGLLTVAINEDAESLIVKATSAADKSKSDTAVVTITGSVTVTGVTVDPPSAVVPKGGTQVFTVLVTGTNNPAQTVTWTVSGGGAGTGIVNGLLTVAGGETAGTLTVTATSTVDTLKSGTATVTVIEPPTVSSVTVTPASVELSAGASRQFIATVTGTNNPSPTVTWTVTSTLSTIDTLGVLTVAANETASALTVTATSTVDTSKSGTASVTITRTPLTGAVTISGYPRAGSTLYVNTSNLFGTGTISYQWQRGDTADGSFTNISGATDFTYIPVAADVTKFLSVSVTRTGNSGSIASNALGPVQSAPDPSETDPVNGTVTVNNGIENETVSFDNAGNLSLNKNGSLTVTVSGSYQAYRWYVDTVFLSDETGPDVTLNGADYESGNHRILVIVYRNNIPYSQEIRFTVN